MPAAVPAGQSPRLEQSVNTHYTVSMRCFKRLSALIIAIFLTLNIYSIEKYVSKAIYDSSADFWKLIQNDDGTHELIDDGKRDLTIQYRHKNADGTYVVFGSKKITDTTGSMAASLTNALTMERATELLGGDLNDASKYDEQTLIDVLGCSPEQAGEYRRLGRLDGVAITNLQYKKLAGEAIMKREGYQSDGNSWVAPENAMSLTIRSGEINGQIAATMLTENGYDYHTIVASVYRNEESYLSNYDDKTTRGKDSAIFYKLNLDGKILDSHRVSDLQTVDVYDRTDSQDINRDQPYNHPVYGNIQGNTIVSNNFMMRYESTNSTWPLKINSFFTMDNDWVDYLSSDGEPGGAWMWHETKKDNQLSDGCFIPTIAQNLLLRNQLTEWQMPVGYSVYTYLYNVQSRRSSHAIYY